MAVTARYEVDLKKLVANAEAAGFNPLTVLRNGGAAGFMVEDQPLAQLAQPVVTAPPILGAGTFTPEAPIVSGEEGGFFEPPSVPGFNPGRGYTVGAEGSSWEGFSYDYSEGQSTAEKFGTNKTGVGSASKSGSGMFAGSSYVAASVAGTRSSGGATVKTAGPGSAGVVTTSTAKLAKDKSSAPASPHAAPKATAPGKPAAQSAPSGKPGSAVDRYGYDVNTLKFGPGILLEIPAHWEKGEKYEDWFGDTWGDAVMLPMVLDTIGHNWRRFSDWGTSSMSNAIMSSDPMKWLQDAPNRVNGPMPAQEPVDWGR